MMPCMSEIKKKLKIKNKNSGKNTEKSIMSCKYLHENNFTVDSCMFCLHVFNSLIFFFKMISNLIFLPNSN